MQENKEENINKVKDINEQLIEACKIHDLQSIKKLIKDGANVNYIQYSNSNGWYSGDTTSPLYAAVHSNFKDNQSNYIDVIEYLLQNKADTKFQAIRGNWNHCTSYPIFSRVGYMLNQFKNLKQKIRFIEIFVKVGANLNQVQRHSRSKNWRAYRTHTYFIFELMEGCGLKSKISKLIKTYGGGIDINKLNKQKYQKQEQQFLKQYPQYRVQKTKQQQQQQEGQQEQEQDQQNEKQQKQPQIQFIQALINFGVDPNSSSFSHYWQNYQDENYDEEQGNYEKFHKFDQKISETYQNILHRAIMNNSLQLVQFLIKKGAKVDKNCKFTIQAWIYPNQWPQQLKQRKINRNNNQFKQAQKQKEQYQQQLKNTTNQQQKQQIKNNLQHSQRRIFQAKRYAIQNQQPIATNQIKELNCVELAQRLKVKQQIIDILKIQMAKTPVKWQEQKKNMDNLQQQYD